MTHIDDDRLLEYALKTRDDPDFRGRIEAHLSCCRKCRGALAKILEELDFIGSIELSGEGRPVRIIRRPASFRSGLLKAAALIIFGLIGGFSIGSLGHADKIAVVPADARYFPSAPAREGVTATDATTVMFGEPGISDNQKH
jgi:hypothetical protein